MGERPSAAPRLIAAPATISMFARMNRSATTSGLDAAVIKSSKIKSLSAGVPAKGLSCVCHIPGQCAHPQSSITRRPRGARREEQVEGRLRSHEEVRGVVVINL